MISKFRELKKEVFIFFPLARKINEKSQFIDNWEIIFNLCKRLESILRQKVSAILVKFQIVKYCLNMSGGNFQISAKQVVLGS